MVLIKGGRARCAAKAGPVNAGAIILALKKKQKEMV